MIVSVFIRRLKPGRTFEDFVREWEADVGFGVPTRVVSGPNLDDPTTVRIDTVVQSTELRAMFEGGRSTTSPRSRRRSTSARSAACSRRSRDRERRELINVRHPARGPC